MRGLWLLKLILPFEKGMDFNKARYLLEYVFCVIVRIIWLYTEYLR